MRNKEAIQANRVQIGQQLKTGRIAREISQEEAAQATGITPATIEKIEGGKFPYTVDLVYQLATLYGIQILIPNNNEH